MPVDFSGDRKLLVVLAVIGAALLATTAFFAPEEDPEGQPLSTYSAHSGGAKATFLLFHELGYSVERWPQPPGRLPEEAAGTLLILAKPERLATGEERSAIDRYLKHGGTVLAAGQSVFSFLPRNNVQYKIPTRSWQSYPAMDTNPYTAGVPAITMPRTSIWAPQAADRRLYGSLEDGVVALTFPVGKGRVIWLGSHIPLSNAGLKANGNPEFLANVLAETGARRILWDTYFTEAMAEGRGSLASAPVLAASAQLLFVFTLILWTYARRFGPIHRAEFAPAIPQSEFVKTLGSLYRSAKATNIALEIAYRRFTFLAGRHLGLPASC